ncbi:MAG TPA: MraY family glycosyltransferase, partial [Pseudomonadota bacterium]|nr:MraY family glycosyltransferase [Pseudomonadota bacterium]
MGDSGSLFLGYLLATTSIWSVRKSATAVLVVFPVVALGLPLLDTGLTISRRFLAGRPVMQADRDHVHHRLLLKGLPVRRAVLLLYGVCLVFSGLSLLMVLGSPWAARLGLALSVGFALSLGYWFGYLRSGPQGLWAALTRRGRTQKLLARLDVLQAELQAVQSLVALEQVVEEFGDLLGVTLRLDRQTDAVEPGSYPIMSSGKQGKLLAVLRVSPPEHESNPDERTLIGLFCDALAPTLLRVLSTES